uniref:Uncharacterized protein n=1 Tax=viral metagenome TaxID=1070528 RepID=A0A6M3KCG8_9ZZZZ
MYDELLKEVEDWLNQAHLSDEMTKILDIIIKIKTIQMMDVSAELVTESRRVSRN